MNVRNFIKYELANWNKFEIISLFAVFSLILINTVVFKDSPIAVISAICGITYTMFAGKGKISCYFFGLAGSGCYVYLSLKSALYANMLLYLCYYIPMQVVGIFKWKKHLKKENHEIIKRKLSKKEALTLTQLSILLSVIVILVLNHFHDGNPIIDGITASLSVVGMYLTVKRCIEQWVIWMIVNGLSFLMWLEIVLNGTKAIATVVMWGFYFILAVYFYFIWKKELKKSLP